MTSVVADGDGTPAAAMTFSGPPGRVPGPDLRERRIEPRRAGRGVGVPDGPVQLLGAVDSHDVQLCARGRGGDGRDGSDVAGASELHVAEPDPGSAVGSDCVPEPAVAGDDEHMEVSLGVGGTGDVLDGRGCAVGKPGLARPGAGEDVAEDCCSGRRLCQRRSLSVAPKTCTLMATPPRRVGRCLPAVLRPNPPKASPSSPRQAGTPPVFAFGGPSGTWRTPPRRAGAGGPRPGSG